MNIEEINKKYLDSIGVKDERLQRIAIDSIPCGEDTVQVLMDDKTDIEVNAVRALMVVHYKGILKGLKFAQRALIE